MGGPTQQPDPGDLGDLIWILQIPSHTARVPSPASVAADLARVPSPGTAEPRPPRLAARAPRGRAPTRTERAAHSPSTTAAGPLHARPPKRGGSPGGPARGLPEGALKGGLGGGPAGAPCILSPGGWWGWPKSPLPLSLPGRNLLFANCSLRNTVNKKAALSKKVKGPISRLSSRENFDIGTLFGDDGVGWESPWALQDARRVAHDWIHGSG